MENEGLRLRKTANAEPSPKPTPEAQSQGPAPPKENMWRKIVTRTIWGSLMMGFFMLVIFSDHLASCGLILVIQVILFKELMSVRYREAKEKNLKGFRTLHWYVFFSSLFYFYGPTVMEILNFLPVQTLETMNRSHIAISFGLYVFGFMVFVATLKKKSLKYQISQITWTLLTIVVVVVQTHSIIHNIFTGLFWFLYPCILIIGNDIMAYFCGITFGRKFINRPLTKLSPNKTWEGFIGALIFTLIFGFVLAGYLARWEWLVCPKEFGSLDSIGAPLHCQPLSLFIGQDYQLPQFLVGLLETVGIHKETVHLYPVQFHGLILSIFAAVISPFGGFFASAIKRAYGIKDFNSLFPGHGGMMDRMDCQLINGLFIYVYLTVFIRPSFVSPATIMHNILLLPVEEQIKIFQQLNQTLVGRI